MKRKLYVMIAAGLLPVLALAFGLKVWAGNDSSKPLPQDPPDNAVGYIDSEGTPHLLVSRLVTTFVEGGTIDAFEFVTLSNGLNLVRRGTTSAGHLTETMPVIVEDSWVKYQPVPVSCCYSDCDQCYLLYGLEGCHCLQESGYCSVGPVKPTRLVSDIVDL